jgi:hypothetical protein
MVDANSIVLGGVFVYGRSRQARVDGVAQAFPENRALK